MDCMKYLPTQLGIDLQNAYAILVKGFGKTGSSTAPGPGATVAGLEPASFAQKLWRSCIHPLVVESALIEPMHQAIRQEVSDHPGVLLAIHDRSTLSFAGHPSQTDRVTLTHAHDVGYDLASVLMVRADDGAPIAPALVSLTTADGVLSARDGDPTPQTCHIDQVRGALRYVHDLGLGTTPVHVIDREADAVDHWRQWSADGRLASVRGDDRKVLRQGQETSLVAIADGSRQGGALKDAGAARYHGRAARLYVAEAEVVLHRPGRRQRGDQKVNVSGPALPLRLVVTEVRDLNGRILARWLLLTNVPTALADAATIAQWYYCRWRIESMHKLIKKAGCQLESWLQRDGQRILKKLLIAFGACASIWAPERRHDAESEAFQRLLMQLSGRPTKRDRTITTGGMWAGLWVLQAAVGPLARHGADRLNAMLEDHLPLFATAKKVCITL
jgi:hypothetical protein